MSDSDGEDATKQDKPARLTPPQLVHIPDFGPRYRVIGVIGKGGMGEVFRAYDNELKGDVALKVVRTDADHDSALARFRREIALARKVTSPNVLRVYDLDEHDGLRFLSMEYVEGLDLAALMRKEGKLPIERAIELFRQICQGLAAAHAQGVVHRDLKPQNVLVGNDDRVRVADFGLARSIGESGLTASGSIVGSPAYMSPEQVKGDPTDERSDIYSLGIMVYQLVTGETPFRADTPHAVMEMRLHKKAPLLRDVRADTPAHVEGICAKCLALAPSARFASIAEILAILDSTAKIAAAPRRRWPKPAVAGAALAGVVAIAAVAVLAWPRKTHDEHAPAVTGSAVPTRAATTKPVDPSLHIRALVLPFENRTGDVMLDGTLDEILFQALGRGSKLDPVNGVALRVLATDLGSGVTLDDELGPKLAESESAGIVTLRGAVAPKGQGFALTLTATDARTRKVTVAKSEEVASLAEIVPAVGKLASAVRAAYDDPVPEAEQTRTGMSLSVEADHEFTIGRALVHSANWSGAIDAFQRALARDPDFAYAHMQLSSAYGNTNRPTQAAVERELTLKHIDQVAEDDRLGFLADYYNFTTGDYDKAIAMYEQLTVKWPNTYFWNNLALAYLHHGDAKRALDAAQHAARAYPKDPISRSNLAMYEMAAGDFAHSATHMRLIVADVPRPMPTWFFYIAAAEQLSGNRAAALAALDDAAKVSASSATMARADHALAEGRARDAIQLLDAGIAADEASHETDAAAIKRLVLAEAKLRAGDRAGARVAAEAADAEPTLTLAASLVELAVGDDKRALANAKKAAGDPSPSRRALAKLVEAEAQRVHGQPLPAMAAISDAIRLENSVMAHLLLARAAIDAKRYGEAYAELEVCLTRRGELAMTADDVPQLRYVPLVTYYLAKAQAGLGNADARKSFAAFLGMLHEPDASDPFAADARKHAQ